MKNTLIWLIGLLGSSLPASAMGNGNFLEEILIPGEEWVLLGEGYRFSEGTAVDRDGTVYFNDIQASIGYRIVNDKPVVWCPDTGRALGQTFGTDGRTLFMVSSGFPKVTRYNASGERDIFSTGSKGNDIVCHPSGNLYLTNPPGINAEDHEISRIWLIRPNRERVLVYEGIRFTNGIAVSPDGKTLYVNDWRLFHVYRFDIMEDGQLGERELFVELDKPDDQQTAGSDGMRIDSKGRIWVTTRSGIQIFDETGRPLGILEGPTDRNSHLVFGGPEFDTLYLTTVKAIYKRKLKVRGLNPWD